MKKIMYLLLLLVVCSCNNDLDLNADFRDIPIVYGLLNPMDTAQYIRVERAFIDDVTPPATIAQIPDSLYYDNAIVSLTQVSTQESIVLDMVDGTNEGFPRQEGAFATSPNYLFKVRSDDFQIVGGEEYQLSISRGDQFPDVTASTTVVSPFLITQPSGGTMLINIVPDADNRIAWQSNENSFIFDVKINFNFLEKDLATPGSSFEERTITWDVRSGVIKQEGIDVLDFEFEGVEFYSFLLASLEANENLDRRPRTIDVLVFSGGEELASFQTVANANLGITSSQDIPSFTNLSEGRGLFSSRSMQGRFLIELAPPTMDSLINGTRVESLNFN